MHHSRDDVEAKRFVDEFLKEAEKPKIDKLEHLVQLVSEEMKLGATGEFPEGKLTRQDEGEIRIAVTATDGKVVLAFGSPVTWLGFSPKQARSLAELLRQRSYQAAQQPEPDVTI